MEFTMNLDGSLAPGKSADNNKSQATGPQGPANAETVPQAPPTPPPTTATRGVRFEGSSGCVFDARVAQPL